MAEQNPLLDERLLAGLDVDQIGRLVSDLPASAVAALLDQIAAAGNVGELPPGPLEQAVSLDDGYRTRDHLGFLSGRVAAAVHDVEAGRSRFLTVQMPPRMGKALAVDTPVPTPDGWTTIAELTPGDAVFDDLGIPCHVIAVSPVWHGRECFRVETQDGCVIIADADHEWVARLPGNRSKFGVYDTRTLAAKRNKRVALPAHGALQLPAAPLLLDPYLLGAWLGDGDSDGGGMTSADPFVIDQFRAAGFAITPRQNYRCGIRGLRPILRRLGVLTEQGGKRIPANYLRGSIEQRTSLLEGLIDTDGYIAPKSGGAEITLTNERLARQTQELVYTLGVKARLRPKSVAYRVNGEVKFTSIGWRLCFRHPHAARLPRKAQHLRPVVPERQTRSESRYIEVTETVPQATRCIEVDSPSQMFLAGRGMVPTHNSQMSSVYLPVWMLRGHPDWRLGLISHSPDLAVGWGRQVRRIIERHGPSLGLKIAEDAGAAAQWQTSAGGGIVSRSAPGQSVTGLGFKVLILDDVTKDFATAHSAAHREILWDWWRANSRTRLEPPSLVVVIGTRWHEDDFIGRLLSPEYDGRPADWEVISFPAIAEHDDLLGRQPGQPLYSPLLEETEEQAIARWDDIRASVGSYAWASLYQQRPAPAQGKIFNTEWWRYWTTDPGRADGDRVVQLNPMTDLTHAAWLDSWDMAFKATTASDYVVGQRWARTGARRYLIAQQRGRWTFTQTLDRMRRWGDGAGPYGHLVHRRLVEDKANGTAILDTLRDQISGLIPVNPGESKEARARAVTPEVEAGNVFLPHPGDPGNDWVSDLLAELRDFNSGAHDDQCLVGSTVITRPDGVVPIADVRVGDVVLGVTGWVTVTEAGCTGIRLVVDRVGLSGTADHPVWTCRGWQRLSDIAYSDTLWMHAPSMAAASLWWPAAGAAATTADGGNTARPTDLRELESYGFAHSRDVTGSSHRRVDLDSAGSTGSAGTGAGSKRSPTRASSSAGIPTPSRNPIDATSSLAVPISPAASRPSTGRSTRTITAPSPMAGTSTTATTITPTTPRRTFWPFRTVCTWMSTATNAANAAGRIGSWPILSGSGRRPPNGTGLRKAGHGIVGMQPGPCRRFEAVYNLTTTDGTYFANGILVHNCDALTQALSQLRDPGHGHITIPGRRTDARIERVLSDGGEHPGARIIQFPRRSA